MKNPAMYDILRKDGVIEQALLDEINSVVSVMHIIENALQDSPIGVESEIPDFYWGAGWILGKVREHIESAVKHSEDRLKETDKLRKKNAV